jgi:hypothetical protein
VLSCSGVSKNASRDGCTSFWNGGETLQEFPYSVQHRFYNSQFPKVIELILAYFSAEVSRAIITCRNREPENRYWTACRYRADTLAHGTEVPLPTKMGDGDDWNREKAHR